MKPTTKKKLMKNLKGSINWLYKDRPFISNLNTNIMAIIMFIIIHMILLGSKYQLYDNYFEHIVIMSLVFILFFHTTLEGSGWGSLSLIFVYLGGAGIFVYNSTFLLILSANILVFLVAGCFIYNVITWDAKKCRCEVEE